MKTTLSIIGLAGSLALGLQGCTHHPSLVDNHMGEALQSAIKAQTMASSDVESAPRPMQIDGQAVKSSIDRYQKSFETLPSSAPLFTPSVK